MNVKESKLTQLNLNPNNVITTDNCAAIKGGALVWCCVRNQLVEH